MAEFSLDKVAKKLRKKYATLGIAAGELDPEDYISTGNIAVDHALEGGIACGYAVEWSGLSGSGKSLFLQIMIADFQRKYTV